MPRSLRFLTILLFACALALRAWVPAGWMPAPGAHSFAIMPCPAAAPTAMMDMGHGPEHRDHPKPSGDCFSPLLAGVALPDPPPLIRATAPRQDAGPTPVLEAVAPTGLAAPPPFSTGPPALT
jgi:hypothetical protein